MKIFIDLLTGFISNMNFFLHNSKLKIIVCARASYANKDFHKKWQISSQYKYYPFLSIQAWII
jgi:hypothetical protein